MWFSKSSLGRKKPSFRKVVAAPRLQSAFTESGARMLTRPWSSRQRGSQAAPFAPRCGETLGLDALTGMHQRDGLVLTTDPLW